MLFPDRIQIVEKCAMTQGLFPTELVNHSLFRNYRTSMIGERGIQPAIFDKCNQKFLII